LSWLGYLLSETAPISLYLSLFISPAATARAERGKINTMFRGQAKKGPMIPVGEPEERRAVWAIQLHHGAGSADAAARATLALAQPIKPRRGVLLCVATPPPRLWKVG
jgi:hypothetical protein